MAWDLIKYGKLPYLGSWDHNFPGVVYIHAIGILLFGSSDTGFRIIDVLAHLATAYLLFRILSHFFTPQAALSGAVLYITYYVAGTYWAAGQRDSFATLFLAWASYLILCWKEEGLFNSSGKTSRLFVAGVFYSFAVAIRPTYALFALVTVLYLFFYDNRKILNHTKWLLLGAISTWIVILVPYLFYNGGLEQFYQATIQFNLDVYGSARKAFSLRGAAKYLITEPLFILGLLALIPDGKLVKKAKFSHKVYFGGALFSAWISIYVMGKFFIYHYEPLLAVASCFAAIGLWKVASFFPAKTSRFIFVGLLLGVVILEYPWFLPQRFVIALQNGAAEPVHSARLSMKPDSLFGLAAEEAVCNYLNKVDFDHTMIELASVTPGIHWRARREEASRFTMIHALAMREPQGNLTSFQKHAQQEYIEVLQQKKPRFIILANGPDYLEMFSYKSPATLIHQVPGFDSVLNSYRLDTVIRGFSIYRHND